MKEQLVEEIIKQEWEMFNAVNNVGGRSTCQEDPKTFEIMRASQAEAWPENLLASYHDDLEQAKANGRNLMTEKYARMMETTVPQEYAAIASLLPPIDDETLELIDKIVRTFLTWKIETTKKYPYLASQDRMVYTEDDSPSETSFETYFRGELKTYSPKTVQLFYEMTLECQKAGANLEETYLFNSVKKYGYESLKQAEDQAYQQLYRKLGRQGCSMGGCG